MDGLPDGRVMSVAAGTLSLALVHLDGVYSAMDNHCPHQGGPLGEGSIECGKDGRKWLRCPWHGWDFDPISGKTPGGFDDDGQQIYQTQVREDGIYVGVPAAPERRRTVSDLMVETLGNWGIKRVFGIVGHSNLELADAMRQQQERGELEFISVRHEGAASFACSGYAKLTGKPAACLSIAGPGATNLMTGLWDAKVDRAPVLALTGQVRVQVFGPGAFQELDLAAAFAPVARFSQTVLPESKHAELASLACKTALVERDVAHLIFPDDVQNIPMPDAEAGSPEGRLASTAITPDAAAIERAAELLAKAERPLIVAGFGAWDSAEAVRSLGEQLGAPIVTTFKGKGLIPDTHPCAGGVLGRSGTPIASWFMNECDLMLALGTSFADHTGITAKKPIVQIDFDRNHLGKNHAVTLPVWGDIGRSLQAISERLAATPPAAAPQLAEIAERWRIWRAEKASRRADDRGKGLNSAEIFQVLTELLPDDAVIAVDVGNNTYSFGRYFECKRQRILMSGYLGSIGFGLPAAMGAYAATQDDARFAGRKVVSISGDGGFGQYLGDWTTAVKYDMDITHLLLNNSELGKISKEQRSGELPVWQTHLHNPSFAAFSKLCGGFGQKVERAEQLPDAVAAALAHKGPALVELMTDVDLV